MHRLQELVRLHRLGTCGREVSRLLRMGPNTERQYRLALQAAGLLEGPPEALPAADVLRAAVEQHRPARPAPQQTSSLESRREAIEQMLRKGSQPKAIYDALRQREPGFGASLSAVKRMCRQLGRARGVQAEDVVIPVETDAGEVAQVDFGEVDKLYDPQTGQLRRAWIFVLVLGFSRHMFARLVFDQRVETWLALHVEAFAALRGVPRTLVPDNLKAAVVRTAFGLGDSPTLNRSYRELARHYGFKIDPTPPYAPQKKGKVESGVKYAKRNFFPPRELADIDDANRQLDAWVQDIAGLRVHGTTGRRPAEVFKQQELAALLPLPPAPFESIVWKPAHVHHDSHVVFEKRLYSVPWRFIGKEVWLRIDAGSVLVYFEDVRIATHARRGAGPRSTQEEHLPPQRAALRHRSREFWVTRADALGEAVGAYIREVFDADDVLSMLRTVQAMVTCLEQYPSKRAQAACARASYYGSHSYKALKNILVQGLDLQPLPTALAPAPGVLQNPRYARKAAQLLQLPLEVTHEPN